MLAACRFAAVAVVLLAGTAQCSKVEDASVAGVQKVIQMLTDMSVKAKEEKHSEEILYAKFKTWCALETVVLKKAIAKSAEEIETLGANIEKLTSDVKTLGDEIAQLEADITKYEADKAAQTSQREKDHKDHTAEAQDYGESVDALERAIATLQKENYDRKGAASVLLQLSQTETLPSEARSMMAAFLGMMDDNDDTSSDFMSVKAPEANAYEFQSGSIIDLLKRLCDEFRSKKAASEKEEMNSLHAYNMIVQDLTDSIENAHEDVESKTASKQAKAAESAEDKKQLAATLECKATDEKTLSDMKTECLQKGLSYEEKQQLRAEEIEAIEKAIEILSSEAVSGNAEKHLDLVQSRGKASAFVQVRGGGAASAKSEGVNRKVREFLKSEAKRLGSQKLGLLAEKLAADPFAKVKKMIDAMITRLLEEANSDATHEGFCDKEMGQSKVTRDKLTEEIDQLDAAIESGKATIAALTQDIATLSEEVAALDAAMAKATAQRTAEKEKNAATVADAVSAQSAVQAAMAVIQAFYAKAGGATALLQTRASRGPLLDAAARPKMGTEEWNALANPDYVTGGGSATVDKGHKAGMQTFGKTYQGQQDEAGGVLTLLDVILSDFANLQADTEAAEASAATEFKNFMTDATKNKAVKEKKIEMNTADKVDAEGKLRDDIKDIKSTQDELLAADRYYEKLVPQCIDKGMTFEERTKAREAEIASLKEALSILGSADISTSAF